MEYEEVNVDSVFYNEEGILVNGWSFISKIILGVEMRKSFKFNVIFILLFFY